MSAEKVPNRRLWKLNITFEYTARYIPYQNHLAELILLALTNRARAMLNRANIPIDDRYNIFKYATLTVTKLNMISVVKVDSVRVIRYLHWSGAVPKFAKYLRKRGRCSKSRWEFCDIPELVQNLKNLKIHNQYHKY